jgi:hypothetical protein
MKAKNPMSKAATVEKMRAKLVGRTFLARGGNSKLTKHQIIVAERTGLPTEVAIATRAVRDEFESLPFCYKVDLASEPHRLAIEIDGKSHRLKRWKFLDRRKTSVLNALGWTVIRYLNEEVEEDLERIVLEIERRLKIMPVVGGAARTPDT